MKTAIEQLFALIILASIAFSCSDCNRNCSKALEDASILAETGKYAEAIKTIDSIDLSCNCMQFTEGDEPPEYSAMRYYLKKMEEKTSADSMRIILKDCKGPVFRELSGINGTITE